MKYIQLSLLCSVVGISSLVNIEARMGHNAPVHVHNANTQNNASVVIPTKETTSQAQVDNNALKIQVNNANNELVDMQNQFKDTYGVEMKFASDVKDKLAAAASQVAVKNNIPARNKQAYIGAVVSVALVGVAVIIGKIVYDSVKKKTGMSDQEMQAFDAQKFNTSTVDGADGDKKAGDKKGVLKKIQDAAAQGLTMGVDAAKGMLNHLASMGGEVVKRVLGKKKISEEKAQEEIKKFFDGELTDDKMKKMEQAGIKLTEDGGDMPHNEGWHQEAFNVIKGSLDAAKLSDDYSHQRDKAVLNLKQHNVIKENGEWNRALIEK